MSKNIDRRDRVRDSRHTRTFFCVELRLCVPLSLSLSLSLSLPTYLGTYIGTCHSISLSLSVHIYTSLRKRHLLCVYQSVRIVLVRV